MSETVTGGALGPRAVAELKALAEHRAQVVEQYRRMVAGISAREATYLAMIAETAGRACAAGERYGYELDDGAPRWWAIDAVGVEVEPPVKPYTDEG